MLCFSALVLVTCPLPILFSSSLNLVQVSHHLSLSPILITAPHVTLAQPTVALAPVTTRPPVRPPGRPPTTAGAALYAHPSLVSTLDCMSMPFALILFSPFPFSPLQPPYPFSVPSPPPPLSSPSLLPLIFLLNPKPTLTLTCFVPPALILGRERKASHFGSSPLLMLKTLNKSTR